MRREAARPAVAWWADMRVAPLLALAAALPLLLPAVQALGDLPAHLAQFRIQQGGGASPLARYFSFGWRPIPNLAVDAPVALLGTFLPIELATKLVVAAIPALAVIGMLGTARAVHGRIPATAWFALPLSYSYPFNFGFLNSSLATALALVALGPWLRLTQDGRWRARALFAAAIAPVLLFAHMIGYGTFGLIAGGAIVGVGLERREAIGRTLGHAVLACLPLLWPLPLLLLSPNSGGDGIFGWFDLRGFALWAIGLLRDGSLWWDGPSTLLLYAVMALPLVWRRRFAFALPLLVPASLLWAAALVLPSSVIGTSFASARLVPTAALLTILAVRPRAPLPQAVTAAALLFFLLRLAGNAHTLLAADAAFARELPALEHIVPGSRVVAFEEQPCRKQWPLWRTRFVASYAVVRRDAFVNATFAPATGQLIEIRDPALARMPDVSVLPDLACGRPWPFVTLAEALARADSAAIDYLWLIDVAPARRPRDPRLHPIWSNGPSILYGVRR